MCNKLLILKVVAEKEFPSFTGRIILDMIHGQVGSTEKTEKERYDVKIKGAIVQEVK